MFDNKTLLITGGTGSFGQTVLKRFLKTNVKEIIVFSRDEKKQEEIRLSFNNDRLKFYIGDVRDYSSIYSACCGVDYIFHAAALKQVPSCEFYPMEALKTNVLGTENVLRAATAQNVQKVIVLSTDKAVYPINAMGLTKALAEKVMIAQARLQAPTSTVFCATRYGNVMASRGSVIPLFIKQLKENKPLTITDPEMTRFLMSLEESVDLVLYAFEHGSQGDIFVQKAPASTVNDLAVALCNIFEKPSHNINIIGTRHGEKLFESLISREEMVTAEDMGNYYRLPADNRNLNYEKYFSSGESMISQTEDYTSHNTHRLHVKQIESMLLQLDYIKEELNA
ncbi:polysaccharide biosynthesis protein [Leeia sp. TBRC 13508]|uniref:UDP-glucose 4-epimerase n=1 Tax=Leeia speluncae TaxID=2884804 RepID=A0ABS8D3S9_9NEIS|nr:polysaccharide biosynthesis protein [Leeia speluncae]MCB6182787.1 polysaccharide biosynthesis protein [Leeia speluncae]